MSVIAVLVIPCLIVGLWRKRPVWAFIIASIILFVTSPIPGLVRSFEAMMAIGESDPQLVAGSTSETLMRSTLSLFILLPLLALFQWAVRYFFKKKDAKNATKETFT